MYVQQSNSYQSFNESIDKIKELYESKLVTYTETIAKLENEIEGKNSIINRLQNEIKKKDELLTITQAENQMNNAIIADLENRINTFMDYEQKQIKKLNDFHKDYKNYDLNPKEKKINYETKYYSYVDNIIKDINKSLSDIIPLTKETYFKMDPLNIYDIKKKNKLPTPPLSKENSQLSPNAKDCSDFFKNCRETMRQQEYAYLMKVIKKANANMLTKQEVYNSFTKILDNKYPMLYSDFKQIFPPIEMS